MAGDENVPLTVVKVGGSLFNLPELQGKLRQMIDSLAGQRILLVPGGGAAADLVREWHPIHALGREKSHWLALHAVQLNAELLQQLVPRSVQVKHPREATTRCVAILQVHAFLKQDERSDDSLPHTWDTTTDAIAARAAQVGNATRLIMLKSVDLPPRIHWEDAVVAGYVDPIFPQIVSRAGLCVEWINLRK
jgi:5-(aminomethyl)-3-furanmethanol phosphate kinase